VPAMVGEVARRKGLAVVLEKAVITDASGNVIPLESLFPAQDDAPDPDGGQSPAVAAGSASDPAGVPAGASGGVPAVVLPSVADPTSLPVSDLGGFEPADGVQA
jgi:trigger factor